MWNFPLSPIGQAPHSHTALSKTPQGQVSLRAPSSSAGWEWKKGEPACRTEWGNRPGWITTPLRQYKPSGKWNFKLSLHETKWPEKFNKLFWFSRQKWGWRKDNNKKILFLWKQVMFQSCKNFLKHFILHTCLPTVCMVLFCRNYTVYWIPCYKACITEMSTPVNYLSSMAYTTIQIKSLWHWEIPPSHCVVYWTTKSSFNMRDRFSKIRPAGLQDCPIQQPWVLTQLGWHESRKNITRNTSPGFIPCWKHTPEGIPIVQTIIRNLWAHKSQKCSEALQSIQWCNNFHAHKILLWRKIISVH